MQKKVSSMLYILAILLAAIVSLIFFNSAGWLEAPKNIFFKITAPVLRPFQLLSNKISGSLKLITEIKGLIGENARLKKENESLVVSVSKLAETERENQFLRIQLELVPPLKMRLILFNIVGFEPDNLGEYFLIDSGKKEGRLTGQAVIYAGGFLVGKISETDDSFSKVMALVDSDSSVFVTTEETGVSGVAKGDHGVGLILDMVPPDKEVKIGETVLSSGLDSQIPRGLIIGKVAEKISKSTDIFQRFKIKAEINYKEIEQVFVAMGNE